MSARLETATCALATDGRPPLVRARGKGGHHARRPRGAAPDPGREAPPRAYRREQGTGGAEVRRPDFVRWTELHAVLAGERSCGPASTRDGRDGSARAQALRRATLLVVSMLPLSDAPGARGGRPSRVLRGCPGVALGAGAVRRGPVRVPALRPVRFRARGARLLHPARVPARVRPRAPGGGRRHPGRPPVGRTGPRGWWAYAPFLAYAVVAQLQAFWLYKRFDLLPAGLTLATVLSVQRRHRARGRRPRRGDRHEALPGDPRPAGDRPRAPAAAGCGGSWLARASPPFRSRRSPSSGRCSGPSASTPAAGCK